MIAMGNLAAITDSLGNNINYSYDSEGNKIKEEIKDSASTLQKTLSYSVRCLKQAERRSSIPDTNYTQYTYDNMGNRKTSRTSERQLQRTIITMP